MRSRVIVPFLVLITLLAYSVSAYGQPENFEDEGFYQSYKFGHPDSPSEDPPKGTHPSYPKIGQKPTLESWRCVTCHGWDYRGRNGAFGSGLNYTGIAGIDGAIGRDLWDIVRVLRDDTHGFTKEQIPDDPALALAFFVSQGQVNKENLIDAETSMLRPVDSQVIQSRGARFSRTYAPSATIMMAAPGSKVRLALGIPSALLPATILGALCTR
jgi:hypothetical protein